MIFRPDNFSTAAPLFDHVPAFVNGDNRFFTDRFTAVEYTLWSVLLHENFREFFLEHVVEKIYNLPGCCKSENCTGPGCRLLSPGGKADSVCAAIVRNGDGSVDVTLLGTILGAKMTPKGQTVTVKPLKEQS